MDAEDREWIRITNERDEARIQLAAARAALEIGNKLLVADELAHEECRRDLAAMTEECTRWRDLVTERTAERDGLRRRLDEACKRKDALREALRLANAQAADIRVELPGLRQDFENLLAERNAERAKSARLAQECENARVSASVNAYWERLRQDLDPHDTCGCPLCKRMREASIAARAALAGAGDGEQYAKE